MTGDEKKVGNKLSLANPSIRVVSCNPSSTEGMCDLKVEIEVIRQSNEVIEGDCGSSALGLTVTVGGTPFQNLPQSGPAVEDPVTGAWTHTFLLETQVSCGDNHKITAELAYIIRPAPKMATPVDHLCPECGGSGGSSGPSVTQLK